MMITHTKRGRPISDKRLSLNIAATVDYRGEKEDQLVFVFRGADQTLVEEVFRFLIGGGHGIATKAIVHDEHDVVRRNGKGYWRIAVEITAPNYNFCSLADMQLLIESVFSRLHPCKFTWMPINKFLNV